MRTHGFGRIIISLLLIFVLSSLCAFSVIAEDPTQAAIEEPEYIKIITEPEDITDDILCYTDGKKNPDAFTWVDNGIAGKALQLDGITQYIQLSPNRVKTLSSFTFSAWFKWSGNDSEKEQRLLCVYKNENRSLIVSPHNTDSSQQLNGIQLALEDPQVEPVSLYHKVSTNVSSALETNEWHHVTVTLSDESVGLYIDGTLYASQALENFSVKTMGLTRLVIGSKFDDDAPFKGLVDNALLFPSVLDENQIALLAQNKEPIAGTEPTTTKEVLATKPYVHLPTSVDKPTVRVLGLSPVLFAVLGGFVVMVIALSLLLSLYRKKSQEKGKEDHL